MHACTRNVYARVRVLPLLPEGVRSDFMAWRSVQKSQPERTVERYLKTRIENLGGICWKFTSPGNTGVPDRCIEINGLHCYVETKRPKGGRLSDMQKWRIKQLRLQGAKVYVLKNSEEIHWLITHIMKGELPSEYTYNEF